MSDGRVKRGICDNCGAQLKVGMRFCSKCGFLVSQGVDKLL